jgi:threonine dehydrogenase-like Zn-dependent dehydrogenase
MQTTDKTQSLTPVVQSCVDCTSGQFNLCETASYYGTPGADGSCCTFRIVPQEQLVPLTPKISWTKAGLIQPLAIVLHMARRAGLKAHQNVMILGGGCVGLLFGAVAKA